MLRKAAMRRRKVKPRILIVRGKGGPMMKWEELVKKFKDLAEFSMREYWRIPPKVRKKCGDLVVVPIVLEAVGRERLKAKMQLCTYNGHIRILRAKRPPKWGLTRTEVCIVSVGLDEIPDSDEVPDSYEDFVNEAGQMLADSGGGKTIDLVLAKNTLDRVYYDLRHGVKKYFELANKKASKEQREFWLANRMEYRYHRGLTEVIEICQKSRAEVSSKIIRDIRKQAEEALAFIRIVLPS